MPDRNVAGNGYTSEIMEVQSNEWRVIRMKVRVVWYEEDMVSFGPLFTILCLGLEVNSAEKGISAASSRGKYPCQWLAFDPKVSMLAERVYSLMSKVKQISQTKQLYERSIDDRL